MRIAGKKYSRDDRPDYFQETAVQETVELP